LRLHSDRGAALIGAAERMGDAMTRRLLRAARWAATLTVAVLATILGVRAYDAFRGPPLDPWHVIAPDDLDAGEIAGLDWAGWLSAEDRVFAEVRDRVTLTLAPQYRSQVNRYFADSPVYPGGFKQDWNRSYVMAPEGPPKGAVVLLHGLTDAPYSMRHIARRYSEIGFVAVVPRMPGHGTVPAALTVVEWEDWLAATHLAVREAARLAGPGAPLHLVGFSNGGALALKYALDALDDPALTPPERIVLLSPMIGITRFARFAGLAGWPAIFPAFARAAWLEILPEFNPFKYNSFPVNGGRQAHLLTRALQDQIASRSRRGGLARMPPLIAFQSAVDSTVSTRAVITGLFAHLPANGSELVLFDVNRTNTFKPLLGASAATAVARFTPPAPRPWRLTVIANADPVTSAVVERVTEAGATVETARPLGVRYPDDIYSLSHVALPFPPWDGLYGLLPDPLDDFGIRLGTAPTRGETGALDIALESFLRIASNPFYVYMNDRLFGFAAGP